MMNFMMFHRARGGVLAFIVAVGIVVGIVGPRDAFAVPVPFIQLTGVDGGIPAGTAAFRADLNALGMNILSITINDNSGGVGGSPGQFSAFDLDVIALSTTSCATTTCVKNLGGAALSVFDFSPAGTMVTPGTQRPVADPKLFGTDGTGLNVDNSVATLGALDGCSSIISPCGFVSMGDGGVLGIERHVARDL